MRNTTGLVSHTADGDRGVSVKDNRNSSRQEHREGATNDDPTPSPATEQVRQLAPCSLRHRRARIPRRLRRQQQPGNGHRPAGRHDGPGRHDDPGRPRMTDRHQPRRACHAPGGARQRSRAGPARPLARDRADRDRARRIAERRRFRRNNGRRGRSRARHRNRHRRVANRARRRAGRDHRGARRLRRRNRPRRTRPDTSTSASTMRTPRRRARATACCSSGPRRHGRAGSAIPSTAPRRTPDHDR